MGKPRHETLCWGCEKACGRCSWSRKFVPVQGWKAEPTKIYQYTMRKNGKNHLYHTDSFDVYECPEFEPLKGMNTVLFLDEVNLAKVKKKIKVEREVEK